MMRIAIDVNDVIREFTKQFAKTYIRGYNHEFDMDELELWTNDVKALFPFPNDKSFDDFTYVQFPYEIFGCAPFTDVKLPGLFNEWHASLSDFDEDIELIIVAPFERGLAIASTMFFLSKFAPRVREYYFPKDSQDIWNKCDVLVTAHPLLLDSKPEGKVTVKISQDYNKDNKADFTYANMKKFMSDENNIEKMLKKYE